MVQGHAPDGSPLLEAVGEDSRQAYKHVQTRRYLHLAPGPAEFALEPPHSYRAIPSADLAEIARLWRDSRRDHERAAAE
jgi:hypothetical protein